MNFEDIEIRTIEKLDLKAGDVLAVYMDTPISVTDQEKIKEAIKGVFLPAEIKVLIVAGAIKLQALRIEDAH